MRTELITTQHRTNSSLASHSLSKGTDLLYKALVLDKPHCLFPRQSAAGCVFTVCKIFAALKKSKSLFFIIS